MKTATITLKGNISFEEDGMGIEFGLTGSNPIFSLEGEIQSAFAAEHEIENYIGEAEITVKLHLEDES